jgi:coenzyme PQQ biosynthesis protein PqqD
MEELLVDGLPMLAPTVVVDEQDATISVLETESGRLMVTNKVGHQILNSCDGTRSVDEIVQAVAAQFTDVAPEVIRADVVEFLAHARAKGVVLG